MCTLTILDPQLTTENGSVYMCVGVKVCSWSIIMSYLSFLYIDNIPPLLASVPCLKLPWSRYSKSRCTKVSPNVRWTATCQCLLKPLILDTFNVGPPSCKKNCGCCSLCVRHSSQHTILAHDWLCMWPMGQSWVLFHSRHKAMLCIISSSGHWCIGCELR